MSPPPTGFEPPKLLPSYNQEFRNREQTRQQQLGLPHQSQGKQSTGQHPRSQAVNQLAQGARPATSFQTTKKPGSGTFDPDKNFKAFEKILQPGKKGTAKDYDFSQYFTKKAGAPTNAPVQRRQDTAVKRQQPVAAAPTKKPIVFNQPTKPTAQRTNPPTARPFVASQPTKATTTRRTNRAPATQASRVQQLAHKQHQPLAQKQQQPQAFRTNQQQAVQQTVRQNQHQAQQQQAIKQTQQQAYKQNQLINQLSRPTVKSAVPTSPSRVALNKNVIQKPSGHAPGRDLLPPLNAIKPSIAATPKGQSKYQWKVPESGLQPPKFFNDSDAQSSKRSITEEGNFVNSLASGEKRRLSSGNSVPVQYKDLQKLFAIPQVEFPLESQLLREGYEKADAVNSFQVKIPYKTGKQERYYYLEHGHCNPECHPYFFKPNRCEPCIKL